MVCLVYTILFGQNNVLKIEILTMVYYSDNGYILKYGESYTRIPIVCFSFVRCMSLDSITGSIRSRCVHILMFFRLSLDGVI